MKRTIVTNAAVLIAVASLAATSAFAAGTQTTAKAAEKPAATATTTAATTTAATEKPAAIIVPTITVSKFGTPAKDAFTVTWTDSSNGAYSYILARIACDKSGVTSGAYAPVNAVKDASGKYSASDVVPSGKYYKYRLSASDGKATVNGELSAVESSVVAAAAPAAKKTAVKASAKKTTTVKK